MIRRFGSPIPLLALVLWAFPCGLARGDVTVPIHLQAQLVSKIGSFDRNFSARAGERARVLVVERTGDDDSLELGAHFASALISLRKIGGITVLVEELAFTTAASLAERCRGQRTSVVYLSTGLDADIRDISTALSGVDVLTVGATALYTSHGTVVGFDLEEGKPRIVVNLTHAKAQNVAFRGELLALARIVNTD